MMELIIVNLLIAHHYAEVQTFGVQDLRWVVSFVIQVQLALTTFTDCKSYGKMGALGKGTLVGAFVVMCQEI